MAPHLAYFLISFFTGAFVGYISLITGPSWRKKKKTRAHQTCVTAEPTEGQNVDRAKFAFGGTKNICVGEIPVDSIKAGKISGDRIEVVKINGDGVRVSD